MSLRTSLRRSILGGRKGHFDKWLVRLSTSTLKSQLPQTLLHGACLVNRTLASLSREGTFGARTGFFGKTGEREYFVGERKRKWILRWSTSVEETSRESTCFTRRRGPCRGRVYGKNVPLHLSFKIVIHHLLITC